jgi:predicted anti-sigma-YlaC factor YlaD
MFICYNHHINTSTITSLSLEIYVVLCIRSIRIYYHVVQLIRDQLYTYAYDQLLDADDYVPPDIYIYQHHSLHPYHYYRRCHTKCARPWCIWMSNTVQRTLINHQCFCQVLAKDYALHLYHYHCCYLLDVVAVVLVALVVVVLVMVLPH